MVKNGHARPPIREVHFRNPRLQQLGLDTLTLAQLRGKAPPEHFARPERLMFYQLLHITGGKGTHQVDFRPYPLRKGALVVTRPKQVQQYHLNPSLQGRLLLIDPVFLAELPLAMADWPAGLTLPSWLHRDVTRAFEIVARETSSYQGDVLTARFLHHVVLALLLEVQRFAAAAEPESTKDDSAVLRLLKAEIETHFQRERSVKYYAQRLGYSEKTLTRACLASEGRTAKALIDERVALEAKRLLAHTRSSAADIAGQLGFSEATNFVKFFQRMARITPLAFRAQLTARRRIPSTS